jgi:hypothetical protein
MACSAATALLLLIGIAHAGEFEVLISDLERLERELESDAADELQLEVDEEYDSADELFPRETFVDENFELREGQVSDTHVYVRHAGVPVILEDVPLTEWFAPYVREMANQGIISGYSDAEGKPLGRYGAADDVTIEHLTKILVEATNVDQSKCPEDSLNEHVGSGSWSVPYLACAEYLRWRVYQDGSIDPSKSATRAEVVYTTLEAFDRDFEPATGEAFLDVTDTLSTADAIETAALDGIVSGYTDENGELTGNFGPFDNVNRAQIAKIVSLAMQVYGE